MIYSNYSGRLRVSSASVRSSGEAERQRIKEATRLLRTHKEKLAWHRSEMPGGSGRGALK